MKDKLEVVVVTEPMDDVGKKKEAAPVKQQEANEQIDDQVPLEESAKEKDESKEDGETKEIVVDEPLKEWFYSLANIQEELAEIQLKVIPELFSKETYDRAQQRITKFQMEKISEFFGDHDD